MMTELAEKPMLAVVRDPWRLRVWYEPGPVRAWRIEVNHLGNPGLYRRDGIACFHEPLWGIDAEDLEAIRETAEILTKELEIELGERSQWASLRV